MSYFRNVNTSFWTDSDVVDNYSPEDKYFMLYALTNNYTNLLGCYEISIKQISNDMGYNKDSVESILKRFIDIHKTIDYNFETKELLIKNWYKFNWNESEKLDIPLHNEIEKIKCDTFHDYLAELYNQRKSVIKKAQENDMVYIGYRYPMHTTITISNTNTNNIYNNNSNIEDKIPYKEIIDYLNEKAKTNYRYSTKKTMSLIRARFNEGFKLEDFKKVIDNKVAEWGNDKVMEQYLRPETLFGTKFEGYLNQKFVTKNSYSNKRVVEEPEWLKNKNNQVVEEKLTDEEMAEAEELRKKLLG